MTPLWFQKEISITAPSRGCHLITGDILKAVGDDLRQIDMGLCNLFVQHTSASLTINENADPSVRQDLESHFNELAPENAPYYIHTYEGPDDMPAHIKAILIGPSLSIPIQNGRLALGIWQGIYLCEHRDYGRKRKLVATIQGEPKITHN